MNQLTVRAGNFSMNSDLLKLKIQLSHTLSRGTYWGY